MVSIQRFPGFGNFKPEENWQCIALDSFYTVGYGSDFSVVPSIPRFFICPFFEIALIL